MLTSLFITSLTLLTCAAFGAWPLVRNRRTAPAARGAAGLLCMSAGVALFAAFCGTTAWASGDEGDFFAEAAEVVADQAVPEAATPSAELIGSAPGSSSTDEVEAVEERTVSPSDQPAAGTPDEPSTEDGPAGAPATDPQPSSEPAAPAPVAPGVDDIEIEADPIGVIIPPGRPAWVAAPPMHVGDDIHTTPVSSGPYARMQDCWRELDSELMKATDAYIAEHLDSPTAPHLLRYDAKAIRSRLMRPQNVYHEQITVSIGPMHQVHGLLEFSPEFRREIETRWNEVRRYSRLGQLGLGAFAALSLLSAMFGYFRVDNATRGHYTGRLQFLTAAAILAVVGVGMVASRFLIWM